MQSTENIYVLYKGRTTRREWEETDYLNLDLVDYD